MLRWNLPGLLLAFLVWPTTASAQGNTEDARRIDALEYRLKALEDQNRMLMEELRAIRAAQPAAPAPGPGAGPVTAAKKDLGLSAMWKDGFRLRSDDGNFDGHFGGRFIFHNRTFTSETRDSDTFYVKEIGLQANGTIYKDYDYDVLALFTGAGGKLQDGIFQWKRYPCLTLSTGLFKEPFSEETLRSALNGDFAENSPMSLLAPGRDLGIQLGGTAWEKRIEYQLAVFNGVGQATITDANDDKDIAARLIISPFAPSENEWLKGIRFGGAMTYGEEKQAFGSLSDPVSGTTFLTMNANVRAREERSRWNVEGAWLAGPFKLQGEASWMDVNLARGLAVGSTGSFVEDRIGFDAWYVEGLWVATGENATLGRRKPAKNLFDDGGCGLIELAFRFSQFDVDDDIFAEEFANDTRSTDGYDQYIIGANWYLNPNVRFTLDFFHNDFNDDVLIDNWKESDEDGFLTRFQIDF